MTDTVDEEGGGGRDSVSIVLSQICVPCQHSLVSLDRESSQLLDFQISLNSVILPSPHSQIILTCK